MIGDEIKSLSPDQMRIWKNGRVRAVERFAGLLLIESLCEPKSAPPDPIVTDLDLGRVLDDAALIKLGELARNATDEVPHATAAG